MAVEFNLGRVRPHYAGAYRDGTEYEYYDWVTHDGSSFVCTSDDGSNSQPLTDTETWAVMAKGYEAGDTQDLGAVRGSTTISAESRFITVSLSGSTTFSLGDCVWEFCLFLTNGGGYTVSWHGAVKWPNGQTPDLTVCQNALLRFVTGDGVTWYGQLCGLNYQ